MSYIKQESSGGGGDISGSGATNQVAFFNGTKTITSDSDFTVNSSNGRLAVTGGVNIPTGSAAAPALAITGDTDTGVFSAGANQIGFTVSGSDALGVGANKNVTVGGASGTAGQVLTSGGSGAATTWTTISGGGGASPIGLAPAGNFTAQPLHASRPWGTNRSSTSTSSDSNAACRPFFVGQAGTVATMIVYVTGGSTGNYLAGIYSDDGGKPNTLLGQASFTISGGAGQRTATSFTAADGTTSKTIVLAADTQYWYATVKESGNGSLRCTDPGRTPFLMQDDSTGVANSWYSSYRDSAANNAFEDTWDVAGSAPSTFLPGSVWVVMS